VTSTASSCIILFSRKNHLHRAKNKISSTKDCAYVIIKRHLPEVKTDLVTKSVTRFLVFTGTIVNKER
jgi:hypothetical protein